MKGSILAWLISIVLAACTAEAPLCEAEHPHQANIDFCFDWSKATGQKPDSMYVLAVRPVQLIKYVYRVSTKAKGNSGVLIIGPDEARTMPSGLDSLLMHNGDYTLMTYNATNDRLDESMQQFNVYPEIPTDSVWISMKPIKGVENYPGEYYKDWKDHNAYSDYVAGLDQTPIYIAKKELSVPTLSNRRSTHVNCTFQPTPISQLIHITYQCQPKEEGIVLDSVICELSGVAGRMQVGTKRLDVSKTYKTLFHATFTPKDNKPTAVLTVKGSVYVPGVVRNDLKETVNGPGVLQTALYIHYYNKDGKQVNRVLQASINLFHALSKSPSVEYNKEGHVVQTKPEITLNIDKLMQLTHEKIEVNDGLGGDQWVDKTTIYVDQED